MNVGIAQGERNPNSSWLNSRGVWLTYIILVFVLHFILLSIPYITTSVAWTLTTTIHNLVGEIFMTQFVYAEICLFRFSVIIIYFMLLKVHRGKRVIKVEHDVSPFGNRLMMVYNGQVHGNSCKSCRSFCKSISTPKIGFLH